MADIAVLTPAVEDLRLGLLNEIASATAAAQPLPTAPGPLSCLEVYFAACSSAELIAEACSEALTRGLTEQLPTPSSKPIDHEVVSTVARILADHARTGHDAQAANRNVVTLAGAARLIEAVNTDSAAAETDPAVANVFASECSAAGMLLREVHQQLPLAVRAIIEITVGKVSNDIFTTLCQRLAKPQYRVDDATYRQARSLIYAALAEELAGSARPVIATLAGVNADIAQTWIPAVDCDNPTEWVPQVSTNAFGTAVVS